MEMAYLLNVVIVLDNIGDGVSEHVQHRYRVTHVRASQSLLENKH